jgi:hypothetical protein
MSESAKEKNFPFEEEVKARFKKWTGIADESVEEALRELTGDTYFEMRKLTSQSLSIIESFVEQGKYCGYKDGKQLTAEQKKCIKEVPEELKGMIRELIEASWRSILNKQKMGIDKLSLSLRPYIKDEKED